MLDNILKGQGKDTAMQVLDILRELSQRHDSIRLLLTGSIGIHHVLRSLWGEGYKGSPLNHMRPDPAGAAESGGCGGVRGIRNRRTWSVLRGTRPLRGRPVGSGQPRPFLHRKPAARPCLSARSMTPALIEAALEKELRSDTSDWDLDYYRRRVKSTFPATEKLVLAILDALATAGTDALSFQQIGQLVSARMATDDEALREHLKLLCMDHYLARDDSNAYRFHLSLIRRWWKINRSL